MRSVAVIGGGVAGCAAAYALAQRGVAVTVFERSPHLASAASGNPLGILHARFGAGEVPLHQFVFAAYQHTLKLLDLVLPVDGINRGQCGLLQLACNPVEEKRITRLAELSWDETLMQFVDAAQASDLAGIEMKFGGLWFPSAGWIVPPQFCAALVDHPNISLSFEHEVVALDEVQDGWRLKIINSQKNQIDKIFEDVVVCCAHAAKRLSPFAQFPLMAVRGQITELPQTPASRSLRTVVCGTGYCTPAVDGKHVIGATHAFEDECTDVRAEDHAENLASLAGYAPALHSTLGEHVSGGRAATRCSVPGSMPLIGQVGSGLYCSLAHGTRGLLTAGIAGDLIAAQMCDEPAPLPRNLIDALALNLARCLNKA